MNSLHETPQGMRVSIAFLGRRNSGKSSLLNALIGYDLAIVSDIAGTTTDPVKKAVEINPLGPCTVIDTAGIDDSGVLGLQRVKKTGEVISASDIGLIILGDDRWTNHEEQLWALLQEKNKPLIVILNKSDIYDYKDIEQYLNSRNIPWIKTTAPLNKGITELKNKIGRLSENAKIEKLPIVGDLIKAGDLVVLVLPIDTGAPKGRLILPQVQTIRDILDHEATAIMVKENELRNTMKKLQVSPALFITDSQVVKKVAEDVPENMPLTTFSTLFTRYKGDLKQMVQGIEAIEQLRDGDQVLIAEACTHHAASDDIGRVKIPRWIKQYTGKNLYFDIAAGPTFPDNLQNYKLIIQCGGCMITRRAYCNRIQKAGEQKIPISNYGIAISYVQGVLPRIIKPFPEL